MFAARTVPACVACNLIAPYAASAASVRAESPTLQFYTIDVRKSLSVDEFFELVPMPTGEKNIVSFG
jgi:hypothetical protein